MTKSYANVQPEFDTFGTLLDRINSLSSDMTNIVVTSAANSAGSDTSGNTNINGILAANTLVAKTSIRGGNVTTAGPLQLASNLNLNVHSLVVGGISMNSATGLIANIATYSNTSGVAATANALTTARTIILAGDATASNTFNGSANTTLNITLANTGVTAGSYGNLTHYPVITVDSKGRLTVANTQVINVSGVTVSSFNTRTGAIVLNANDVTNALSFMPLGNSVVLEVANGNVGVGTATPGAKLTVLGTANISGTLRVNSAIISTSGFTGTSLTVSGSMSSGGSGSPGYLQLANSAGGATGTGAWVIDSSGSGVIRGYSGTIQIMDGSGVSNTFIANSTGIFANTLPVIANNLTVGSNSLFVNSTAVYSNTFYTINSTTFVANTTAVLAASFTSPNTTVGFFANNTVISGASDGSTRLFVANSTGLYYGSGGSQIQLTVTNVVFGSRNISSSGTIFLDGVTSRMSANGFNGNNNLLKVDDFGRIFWGGPITNSQRITSSTTFNFVKDRTYYIEAKGGGGGGVSIPAGGDYACGGAEGGLWCGILIPTANTTATITIGAGGANNGANGGSTTIDTWLNCLGGIGGWSQASEVAMAGGGVPQTFSCPYGSTFTFSTRIGDSGGLSFRSYNTWSGIERRINHGGGGTGGGRAPDGSGSLVRYAGNASVTAISSNAYPNSGCGGASVTTATTTPGFGASGYVTIWW